MKLLLFFLVTTVFIVGTSCAENREPQGPAGSKGPTGVTGPQGEALTARCIITTSTD